ncbi:conserved hypothetical protein [Pediculus humanus corporis]|uniref:Protein kintoun n=1 Tax=Pediculus humanus subsp. corporis TaxID=121224 RepID=E0VG67_PEDHC|nr:uncharacterized protein Phum_PHUM174790 [Pediculus humanus corporis]EEB12373.1 conserved hypothetical protein [Pediculus humanus corporis]
MAGYNRKDWEDLNITKEEVENITQALKKEGFRKLLAEYAEEITDPKNKKQFQEDIIKLEAERGVDCTFVNPEPGFVIKTSVDGNKKAFINISKNKAVGRPDYKRDIKDNNRGLNWSIPLCQAPGREDFDKKRNRCVVYDVIFHPDTIHLTEKNPKFKELVIDTALNAVEESFKVHLDRKNLKFPKLKYKGLPNATVIRKKSKCQPKLSEEDKEFFEKINCPFKPLNEKQPVVRNIESKKSDSSKYTTPKYVVKHRTGIDLQEFTYDKNAKINCAIPKELIIEINLPMLNSTQNVNLDIMEKSLHLVCEKPSKYKLDIQLPYSVSEETGNAKFDKERKLLIVTLPVIKSKMTIKDLIREDSGVESDFSPVGSVSNNEYASIEEENIINDTRDSFSIEEVEDINDYISNIEESAEESDKENECRTEKKTEEFLESDKHYILPTFSCNVDDDKICFVLNVKNVDGNSIEKKLVNSSSYHIKFVSIGSGFFPSHYAFFIDFKESCNIKDVICDTWDNNVTLLIEFEKNNDCVTKYYVGINQEFVTEYLLSFPLELKKIEDYIMNKVAENEGSDVPINIEVESAHPEEVVLNITPLIPENSNDEVVIEQKISDSPRRILPEEKCRTFSESGVDEIVPGPAVRKSILKKRINRSLSESNAEDYILNSSCGKSLYDGSDFCINEEEEVPHIKKTVRFSEKIRQQLFRVNSTILGRKNKNKKKSKNKKRALERKLSESENSETENGKETNRKQIKSKKCKKQPKKKTLIEDVSNSTNNENNNNNNDNNNCDSKGNKKNEGNDKMNVESKNEDENINKENEDKLKFGLKKNDKIFEFKSDLIFDLEV